MFSSIFDKIFPTTPLMDLSNTGDDILIKILLRVPAKDLVKSCTKVSKQWNRILDDNLFWRDKMEQDGYRLEWTRLGLSTESLKKIAARQAFGRNFLKDSWDLSIWGGKYLKLDPRWKAVGFREVYHIGPLEFTTGPGREVRNEIPPVFLDGQPEMPGEPIEACLAIRNWIYEKFIVIKLSDEGLTDEIMDNFRPTIVVSEMVGNRRDCASVYGMGCSLFRDRENVNDHVIVRHNLQYGQAEGWNKVEHVFKEYPAGMRYLWVQCFGGNENREADHYGVKMANCSVKALCEENVPE